MSGAGEKLVRGPPPLAAHVLHRTRAPVTPLSAPAAAAPAPSAPVAPASFLAGFPGLAGGGVSWGMDGHRWPPVDLGKSKSAHKTKHSWGVAEVAVCGGKSCRKGGSAALVAAFQALSSGSGAPAVRTCKCLGECSRAPAVKLTTAQSKKRVLKVRGGSSRAPCSVSQKRPSSCGLTNTLSSCELSSRPATERQPRRRGAHSGGKL